jgi:hypothetical protein
MEAEKKSATSAFRQAKTFPPEEEKIFRCSQLLFLILPVASVQALVVASNRQA